MIWQCQILVIMIHRSKVANFKLQIFGKLQIFDSFFSLKTSIEISKYPSLRWVTIVKDVFNAKNITNQLSKWSERLDVPEPASFCPLQ